jgi:hypothetical protein
LLIESLPADWREARLSILSVRLAGRSTMQDISRDPLDLVAEAGHTRQYRGYVRYRATMDH